MVTREEVHGVVLAELGRVAPELDPAALRVDAPLRDQIDMDSIDFLNFVIALHGRLGVDIPEADYAQLSSVSGIVAYLSTRLGGGPSTLANSTT